MSSRLARRVARTLAVVLALLVAMPGVALAHAHLRRSDPAADARVAPPRTLRLWFSEEPELSLTTVRLLASSGAAIALGAPAHEGADPLSVRLDIGQPLAPGRYTVRWSTAAMDGHPSSGSFSFRVVADTSASAPVAAPVPAAPSGGVAPATDSTTPRASPQDAPYVLVRLLSYAALLALVGAVAFRYAVLSRVGVGHDATPRTLARGAAIAAVLFLVVTLVRLAMQPRLVRDDAMGVAQMEAMALGTRWGGVWLFQLAAGVIALLGAIIAGRGRRAGWHLAALACLLLAAGVAMGGHAVTVERYRALSVADDALHVLAASAWLGGLFWLAVVGLRAPRSGDVSRAARVRSLVEGFSPVALASAAVVALTGLATSWQRLDHLAELWTTAYGQVLLRKLVLVAIVVAFGAFNWQRVRPTLGTDAASRRLTRSAWSELAVGALVLLATAVLVGMPVGR